MGPFNQVKKMFAPTRIIATVLMVVCLVMTIVSAVAVSQSLIALCPYPSLIKCIFCFQLNKAGLSLLFVILQFLSMTWYSLSYIPYARDAVKKTINACLA